MMMAMVRQRIRRLFASVFMLMRRRCHVETFRNLLMIIAVILHRLLFAFARRITRGVTRMAAAMMICMTVLTGACFAMGCMRVMRCFVKRVREGLMMIDVISMLGGALMLVSPAGPGVTPFVSAMRLMVCTC